MKALILSLLLSFVFVNQVVVAAPNQETPAARITELANWVGSNGQSETLWIRLEGQLGNNMVNPFGCPVTDWYILDNSASDISRSMLLAAKVTGQDIKMTIYGNGCNGAPPNDRPEVVNVKLP